MATIRVRDWTKRRIEEIRDAESHSSHDSVIKTLLKDRELAQFAEEPSASEGESENERRTEPADKTFDNLTVLAENVTAENGVMFLWCPNCGNEIAHVGLDDPAALDVVEVECQRCLTRLNQHGLVCIEIGYPLEERLVNKALEDDLKECVIDYWARTVDNIADGTLTVDVDDEEHVLWQLAEYTRTFGWEWPGEVPVVGIEPGQTYRIDATGQRIEFLEAVSENRNSLNDYRVRRYDATDDGEDTTERLEASELTDLLLNRSLYRDSATS